VPTVTWDWQAIGTVVAASVALFSIAKAGTELTGRSRTRARLSTELDIWSKLPEGSEKDGMEAVVITTAQRLLALEDPARRKKQRRVLRGSAFVIIGAAVYLAATLFQPDSDLSEPAGVIAIVMIVVGLGEWGLFGSRSFRDRVNDEMRRLRSSGE
jgi:hypothetical protein